MEPGGNSIIIPEIEDRPGHKQPITIPYHRAAYWHGVAHGDECEPVNRKMSAIVHNQDFSTNAD